MDVGSLIISIFTFILSEISWILTGFFLGAAGHMIGYCLKKYDGFEALIAIYFIGPLQAILSALCCAYCSWWSMELEDKLNYLVTLNFLCFCFFFAGGILKSYLDKPKCS
jgi:hypothetical protein